MYIIVKIMLRYDRKLYWQSGKTWRRLKRMKTKIRAASNDGE